MPNSKTAQDQRLDDHQRQIDTLVESVGSIAQATAENNKQLSIILKVHEIDEKRRTEDSATMKEMALNLASMQRDMGSFSAMGERVAKIEKDVEQALHKAGNALNGGAAIPRIDARVTAVEKMLEGFEDKKVADAKLDEQQNTRLDALTGRIDTVDGLIKELTGVSKGVRGVWQILIYVFGAISFLVSVGFNLYQIFGATHGVNISDH